MKQAYVCITPNCDNRPVHFSPTEVASAGDYIVCEYCGKLLSKVAVKPRRKRYNKAQVMHDLGLVPVRGAVSGKIYWE